MPGAQQPVLSAYTQPHGPVGRLMRLDPDVFRQVQKLAWKKMFGGLLGGETLRCDNTPVAGVAERDGVALARGVRLCVFARPNSHAGSTQGRSRFWRVPAHSALAGPDYDVCDWLRDCARPVPT